MKTVWIVLLFGLLVGCGQKSVETTVVEEFWSALVSGDLESVSKLLANPEAAALLEGSTIELEEGQYEVLSTTEGGVNVRFSSECLADYTAPTMLTEVDGEQRVDLMGTLTAVMSAKAEAQPKKQYCYDFADQPMQGRIGGEAWKAHHVNRAVYDFGAKTSEQLKIVAEPCQDEWCNGLQSPSILVSGLDLSGSGGDFSMENNVTLFIPPNSNKIVTEGSYRVSSPSEGQVKLELSFQKGQNNRVNGFVVFDNE
ncbi:hypothetical protein [Marinimicrobium locisalis]|uniref:hypothetical protein n=1 Tax=Marinimicrobium locisalis TaxID=546022 RepID=UPI003221A8CB